MNKDCELHILDEVNIKFNGLDVVSRRELSNAVKFFVPHAKHTPAYKLGRWDGYERFCNIGGSSYFNLLDVLLPLVQSKGYHLSIKDDRVDYSFDFEKVTKDSYNHIKWPSGHQKEGEPVTLMDHQVQVVNTYLDNLQSLQEIATGAGKTIITSVLSHKVEKYGRSIIIVPSKDLVTQTESDYKNMGLDVGVFYGERKDPNHKHVICTWQSIESLDKKSKKYDPTFKIEDLMKDVVAVIVDECHQIKADVLSKHLTTTFKNVPIRWGLTGTIPLEQYEYTYLISCIGKVVGTVKAKDLQDLGILSNLHINVIQVNDYINTFKDYQSELKYLVTDPKRINFIGEIIKQIVESGNTLILVDRVTTGEMLRDIIPNSVFIHGDVDSKSRKKEYKELNVVDDKPIIATYGVCSTGINVPRVFNVVLFEAGKSFIKVIQSIGRGLRVAKDKDFVNIYDVTSTAKYSKRHLAKRKKFYQASSYPFSIITVDIQT